jgi:hypothetical protein
MKYFNKIQKVAKTLAQEAGDLLDDAKDLKEAIDRTLKSLKLNYSPEDIADEFADPTDLEWIATFTDTFLDDINTLETFCVDVIKNCKVRKSNLDVAIIWG